MSRLVALAKHLHEEGIEAEPAAVVLRAAAMERPAPTFPQSAATAKKKLVKAKPAPPPPHDEEDEDDEEDDEEDVPSTPKATPKKKAAVPVPPHRVFIQTPELDELKPAKAWAFATPAEHFSRLTGLPSGFPEAATRASIKCGIPHDATMTCHQDGRVTWRRSI